MLEMVKVLTRAAANLFPFQWTVRKDCQGQTVCLEKVACSLWSWMCLFGSRWWTTSIVVQNYQSQRGAFGRPDSTWGEVFFWVFLFVNTGAYVSKYLGQQLFLAFPFLAGLKKARTPFPSPLCSNHLGNRKEKEDGIGSKCWHLPSQFLKSGK